MAGFDRKVIHDPLDGWKISGGIFVAGSRIIPSSLQPNIVVDRRTKSEKKKQNSANCSEI